MRRDFLIKSVGHPEVHEDGLFREALGNLLARHFGVRTPSPALVLLNDPFVATARKMAELSKYGIDMRRGTGVGSEYLPLLQPVSRDVELRMPRDLSGTALIYAFDMLVQNPDRTHTRKTNCAYLSGEFVAFDFELCFSFTELIMSVTRPWEVDDQLSHEHLFFPSLKGKVVDWSPFLSGLFALSDVTIEQMIACLPSEWKRERTVEKIVNHLREARGNASRLEKELERSVA